MAQSLENHNEEISRLRSEHDEELAKCGEEARKAQEIQRERSRAERVLLLVLVERASMVLKQAVSYLIRATPRDVAIAKRRHAPWELSGLMRQYQHCWPT